MLKTNVYHAHTPIKRHIKVQGSPSPYDEDYIYWSSRMGKFPTVDSKVAKLLEPQAGKCLHCGLYFQPEDRKEKPQMFCLHSALLNIP